MFFIFVNFWKRFRWENVVDVYFHCAFGKYTISAVFSGICFVLICQTGLNLRDTRDLLPKTSYCLHCKRIKTSRTGNTGGLGSCPWESRAAGRLMKTFLVPLEKKFQISFLLIRIFQALRFRLSFENLKPNLVGKFINRRLVDWKGAQSIFIDSAYGFC